LTPILPNLLPTLLYLVLSFVGGLWTTPQHLPPSISSLSPLVPTRQFGNVLWGAAQGHLWRPHDWLLLAVWAARSGAEEPTRAPN